MLTHALSASSLAERTCKANCKFEDLNSLATLSFSDSFIPRSSLVCFSFARIAFVEDTLSESCLFSCLVLF